MYPLQDRIKNIQNKYRDNLRLKYYFKIITQTKVNNYHKENAFVI